MVPVCPTPQLGRQEPDLQEMWGEAEETAHRVVGERMAARRAVVEDSRCDQIGDVFEA